MERLYPILIALSLFTIAPTALADHGTFEATGEILVGNPSTGVIGGVTELAAPCDTGSDLNGFDGQWHDISGFSDHAFVLDPADTLDADVWFYNASCGFISNSTGAQAFIGANENGTVPENATFAVVDGFVGTGSYKLSIE